MTVTPKNLFSGISGFILNNHQKFSVQSTTLCPRACYATDVTANYTSRKTINSHTKNPIFSIPLHAKRSISLKCQHSPCSPKIAARVYVYEMDFISRNFLCVKLTLTSWTCEGTCVPSRYRNFLYRWRTTLQAIPAPRFAPLW
jgi:hypothetical protein